MTQHDFEKALAALKALTHNDDETPMMIDMASWLIDHLDEVTAALQAAIANPAQGVDYIRKDIVPQDQVREALSGLEWPIDYLHTQGHLTPADEVKGLKDALRDVLKAIVSDRHAVQDTLWVSGTPVGDFIMCALGEDIDLDELQNAPYRCKATKELFKDELLEALLTALPYVEDVLSQPEQLKCFKAGAVQRDVKKIREAIEKAGG